jgi:hypothetical protein
LDGRSARPLSEKSSFPHLLFRQRTPSPSSGRHCMEGTSIPIEKARPRLEAKKGGLKTGLYYKAPHSDSSPMRPFSTLHPNRPSEENGQGQGV